MSEKLTLDMIYHPELAQTWHHYQNFIFFLSTFMNGIMVYVILKKSTSEMHIYKWLLLNQLFWAYLFDFFFTLWQPVILLPFFMCYSTGLTKIFGPNSVYTMFILTFLTYSGLLQSIIVALAFRVSRLYGSMTIMMENKKMWSKVYFIVAGIIMTLFMAPVILWVFTPETDYLTVRKSVIEVEPVMLQIVLLEPTTNGFDWSHCYYIIILGIVSYTIAIIGFTSILIISSMIFFHRMKQIRLITNPYSVKLQIMLFKTLVVQTLLVLATIALPVALLDFMIVTKNHYGSYYAQIGLFPLSIHSLADAVTMLYFIKPYRIFVQRKLKIFCWKTTLVVPSIQINHT